MPLAENTPVNTVRRKKREAEAEEMVLPDHFYQELSDDDLKYLSEADSSVIEAREAEKDENQLNTAAEHFRDSSSGESKQSQIETIRVSERDSSYIILAALFIVNS